MFLDPANGLIFNKLWKKSQKSVIQVLGESCAPEHGGRENDARGHGHLDACYWGATSSVFIATAHKESRVSCYS